METKMYEITVHRTKDNTVKKRKHYWNWKKCLSNVVAALSVLLLLWVFVSFIDVNLHNGIDRYGNPQGGTQWKYNAFVMMVENFR